MVLWFLVLGGFGLVHLVEHPMIIKTFNPYYAIKLIYNSPSAIVILGAVFLCTTGAEALYSDLGHCGIKNIRVSWIFVKTILILNYLGQGAWLLSNYHEVFRGKNPFFGLCRNGLLFRNYRNSCCYCKRHMLQMHYNVFEAMSLNSGLIRKSNILPESRTDVYPKIIEILLMFCGCDVFQRIRKNGSSLWAFHYRDNADNYSFGFLVLKTRTNKLWILTFRIDLYL
jgi:KUP system potassium uptake protein